jgi:hypothetical protein
MNRKERDHTKNSHPTHRKDGKEYARCHFTEIYLIANAPERLYLFPMMCAVSKEKLFPIHLNSDL